MNSIELFDPFRVSRTLFCFLLSTLFMNLMVLHFEECLNVVLNSCREFFFSLQAASLIGNEQHMRRQKVSIKQA